MNDPLLVVLALFAIGGGGIVVLDALIIRRLRRGASAVPRRPNGDPWTPN